MDDGKYNQEHEVTFSEKRWYEKFLEFCKFLPFEAPVFAAVCVSLWGLSEIITGAIGEKLTLSQFAGPILGIGFVVALTKAFYRYCSYVPIPLQNESITTQKIYRHQECGWQFAMARQMLAERLASTEASLNRIERGAEFVEPIITDLSDYIEWLQKRPTTFLRLSHSISVICTSDIPITLASPGDDNALSLIVAEIDSLSSLYEKLNNQELSCHERIPPKPLEHLHSMTYGWTKTIRAGVHQFLEILEKLANIDRTELIAGTVQLPTFGFVFESPPALERFNEALEEFDFSSLAIPEY